MLGLFYPYGFLLQAIAILHFVRRRPDTYWLWIILMGGGLGALVYIAIEVVPDAGLLRGAFQVFPRRKRIKELEGAILDNPSVGNYEELGDLYLDDLQFPRARECYDRVSRRSIRSIRSTDADSARSRWTTTPPRPPTSSTSPSVTRSTTISARRPPRPRSCEDRRARKADALFAEVPETSTLSETQYNYGCFLPSEGRSAEAREWAERILRKKATMPDYIRRRERPWFRKAKALLKRIR